MAREARNSKNKTKQNKNTHTHTHTHTHKVSHFCFYYVKKLTSGRILYIFILSLINSKSTELPPSLGRLWVNGQTSYKRLRASSHEPGRWPGWPGQRDEYRLGFRWEISARFLRWEKAKDAGDEFWRQIREIKQTRRNNNCNFRAYHSFDNSLSRIAAVKWDAYDVKNTAGNVIDFRGQPSAVNSRVLHGNLISC